MTSSFIVCRADSNVVSANSSYFSPIVGTFAFNTNFEARVETPVRDAGVFSNLFAYVSANILTVTATLTLRKSQADTSVLVTWTAGTTGLREDTTNTATFAATDEVSQQLGIPADPTHNLTIEMTGVQFAPTTTSNCVSLLGCYSAGAPISSASITTYLSPHGGLGTPDSSETNEKFRIRTASVAQDLYTYVTSNARTTDTVIKTRKNGADGGQSVTYTSGQTGVKEDTSGTDTLSAGDDYNIAVTTNAGTETMLMTMISCSLVGTNDAFVLGISYFAGNLVLVSFNLTRYFAVGGQLIPDTTETASQIWPRFTFTASELGTMVGSNTITTSPSTITLRDGGADSAVLVTYDAAVTGLKNDSSNTTVITSATDNISYKVVTPNTSGSIGFQWMSLVGTVATAVARIPQYTDHGFLNIEEPVAVAY